MPGEVTDIAVRVIGSTPRNGDESFFARQRHAPSSGSQLPS